MEKVKTLQQEFPMASIRELAEEGGFDTRTIRKFISEGDLPAMQLGHSIRILREDWKKFLEERKLSANKQGDSKTLLVDQQ